MAGKKGMVRVNPSATSRQQAWQSMRIFIEFTVDDILSTASIDSSNLYKYMKLLRRYGYVEEVGAIGVSGQLHYRKRYGLVKDSGPHAPLAYRANGLRDLNTGETFLPEEEAVEE